VRYNIQMVGVGGQGVLLASMVIGEAAMSKGMEVAMSEVHGMAQRGGSVSSTIRMGDDVISPLIPKGGADLLLAFEPIEAYRSLEYANKDTYIVTNTHPIIPITVSMGADEYPDLDHIIEKMRSASSRVIPLNATDIAIEFGGAIATNSVLIGAVAAVEGFPLSAEELKKSLLDRVPEKFRQMNEKAFQGGYQATMDIMDLF
jgi:indolepyruvate ferredoxin oxidoreductase beta subunit